MDFLGEELGGGGGGKKAKDAELAKAMFEGTQQYRKKLKLPEMNAAAEKIKEDVRAYPSRSERLPARRRLQC